jgi:hypothetical protein
MCSSTLIRSSSVTFVLADRVFSGLGVRRFQISGDTHKDLRHHDMKDLDASHQPLQGSVELTFRGKSDMRKRGRA